MSSCKRSRPRTIPLRSASERGATWSCRQLSTSKGQKASAARKGRHAIHLQSQHVRHLQPPDPPRRERRLPPTRSIIASWYRQRGPALCDLSNACAVATGSSTWAQRPCPADPAIGASRRLSRVATRHPPIRASREPACAPRRLAHVASVVARGARPRPVYVKGCARDVKIQTAIRGLRT